MVCADTIPILSSLPPHIQPVTPHIISRDLTILLCYIGFYIFVPWLLFDCSKCGQVTTTPRTSSFSEDTKERHYFSFLFNGVDILPIFLSDILLLIVEIWCGPRNMVKGREDFPFFRAAFQLHNCALFKASCQVHSSCSEIFVKLLKVIFNFCRVLTKCWTLF